MSFCGLCLPDDGHCQYMSGCKAIDVEGEKTKFGIKQNRAFGGAFFLLLFAWDQRSPVLRPEMDQMDGSPGFLPELLLMYGLL